MIKIENLTKIYKTKEDINASTKALDNISCIFPDSGMIFIVGKSGSGKSTFLNILGGLDSPTKGTISVDGNRIDKFNAQQFNMYRSKYTSFIFQDHYVIPELDVFNNVKTSLDIIGEDADERIYKALEAVEMLEYKNKFPSQLSGGQRQRVAVARAICRNSKLILCDEPTGNLDEKTTKIVFNALKELSRDRLVIVVSHNLKESMSYGDRIIEIYGGKILEDKTKTSRFVKEVTFKDGKIYIPRRELSEEELDKINNYPRKNEKLEYRKDDFFVTGFTDLEEEKYNISNSKFSLKRLVQLSGMFLKRRICGIIVTSIIISLIFGCFSVFQSFVNFNQEQAVAESIKKSSHDVIIKKQNKDNYILPLSSNEIKKYKDGGYKEKIYKLYNYSVSSTSARSLINNRSFYYSSSSIYYDYTFGTLACDEQYLLSLFGNNGNIDELAGNIHDTHGCIITDYTADALIKTNPNIGTYSELIGKYNPYDASSPDYNYSYISAVIDSHYREKYSSIVDKAEKGENLYQIEDDKLYSDFIYDAQNVLGIGYSIADDFIKANSNLESSSLYSLASTYCTLNNKEYFINSTVSLTKTTSSISVEPGTVAIPYRVFNLMFETNYDSSNYNSFTKQKIKVVRYSSSKEKYLEYEFVVSKLIDTNRKCIYVNEDEFLNYSKLIGFEYGLVFENNSLINNIMKVNKTIENVDLITDESTGINKIEQLTSILHNFSFIIDGVLLLLAFIFISNFGFLNIKRNKKEIGILKALGARNIDIQRIFIIQNILVGLISFILGFINSYFLIKLSNRVLTKSIQKIFSIRLNVSILYFDINTVMLDLIVLFIFTLVASIVPMIALAVLKPVKIIKGKE